MSTGRSHEVFGGSWIVDAGQNQIKTLATYTPVGDGKYAAIESVFDFDWSLGGMKPAATHASSLSGMVEDDGKKVSFTLIAYALDKDEKAVYILKAVGNKVLKDHDTISVENLVFQFYNDPETANPVTDEADFCVPSSGTFPPVHEYRIRNRK